MIRMWGAFGVALGILSALAVSESALAQGENAGTEPRRYTHPTRMYSVAIPPGASVREPGGNIDIAIDSDKGFGVIIQSASVGRDTSISELAATLEAAYLGVDKPWERKVGQEISLVAGLVSFNGFYEGDKASYRVVITRGQVNTYTFIFRARTDSFEVLSEYFEWLLRDFRPAPGDLPPTPTPPDPDKQETAANEPEQDGEEPTVRKFGERRLGYAIEYDPGWILERPTPEAVMFSGDVGTDAFFTTVSIQNAAPEEAETAVQAASLIMDDIRAQFAKDAQDVVFDHEAPYIYQRDDIFLLGREFTVSYVMNGERFRQWTMILPRSEGRVAHIWSYRAPAGSYDRFLPVAEAMLRSWTIMKREGNEQDVSSK